MSNDAHGRLYRWTCPRCDWSVVATKAVICAECSRGDVQRVRNPEVVEC